MKFRELPKEIQRRVIDLYREHQEEIDEQNNITVTYTDKEVIKWINQDNRDFKIWEEDKELYWDFE
jgi:hypothetical protein